MSPMYTNDSRGSWARIARATVSPPTPESKIPIGASFMTTEPTLRLVLRAQGGAVSAALAYPPRSLS
ncbi:hypothetical protein GCM10027421_35490 [Microbacterium shaanxiense]